ncbi:SRPBCC family protein [Tamlana sp. 2201CG12-4]|uniref:SRPBCC family protein n=1 Tax=Tamlana sp. 2201CG12-4 TaxID=3112582 RepID=UPI002DBFEE25|nr:SRPBCC family protein [Tamlana sp. 2201CG12-4]MEC3906226.1 SRPBCC family protein [Tamlana sp. 2201CG12-4]
MPEIKTEIIINAPREVVFDLARSIDFHKESTKHTQEEAIAGKTSGLLELGESVTWRAKHFGLWLELESKITELDSPNYFIDEMQKGSFKSFRHEHIFEDKDEQTLMIDRFNYKSPYGLIGKLVDGLFLKRYMSNFLLKRNRLIKEHCEKK